MKKWKPTPITIPISTLEMKSIEAKTDHDRMEQIREGVKQWIKKNF
jgi:hypothetical protein